MEEIIRKWKVTRPVPAHTIVSFLCPLSKFDSDENRVSICLNCQYAKGNAANILWNWGSHCQHNDNIKKVIESEE